MKQKINLQLIFIAVLAIFLTAIAITIPYYGLFRKQITADLQISANLLKDTHYFTEQANKQQKIDLTSNRPNLRITWIKSDGQVLYDNDVNSQTLPNHIDRPEIKLALEKGYGESVRQSDTLNENTYYYALKLENGDILRVATNGKSLLAVFLQVVPIIALILLFILLLCIFISHILTKQIIQPIEKLGQNLENSAYASPYKELSPFMTMIRQQHAEVLHAAQVRQDFTANVSHELKTPLTAISGYAELLANDMVAQEKKQHFYMEIHNNALRLLSLIDDIIKLSSLDRWEKHVNFKDVDLWQIVQACCEDNLQVNARQSKVNLLAKGESCIVQGDANLLRELVENLVQNAIRYNKDGGKVQIRVKGQKQATLIVQDNGIGIPLAEQTRIFERFYRVDKSRSKATGGTGLGLAIVKHIVEIHGAKIELTSEPGKGTTVQVKF